MNWKFRLKIILKLVTGEVIGLFYYSKVCFIK